jgi:hypothetical protein
MKKLYITGIIAILSIFGMRLRAQNIVYTYNEAGNRTNRSIIYVEQLRSSTEETSPSETTSGLTPEQEVKLYPNPTKGILTVEIPRLSETSPAKIQIIDISGRTVKHRKTASRQNTFDFSNQANGIYLMKITLNDEISTWKIIKQ